jgi:hypothetical protein
MQTVGAVSGATGAHQVKGKRDGGLARDRGQHAERHQSNGIQCITIQFGQRFGCTGETAIPAVVEPSGPLRVISGHFSVASSMPALPSKADLCRTPRHVSFVAEADTSIVPKKRLLDHLVGAGE